MNVTTTVTKETKPKNGKTSLQKFEKETKHPTEIGKLTKENLKAHTEKKISLP